MLSLVDIAKVSSRDGCDVDDLVHHGGHPGDAEAAGFVEVGLRNGVKSRYYNGQYILTVPQNLLDMLPKTVGVWNGSET